LLASVETEAERMQRYVVKLLDVTRLNAGGMHARIEPIDPADVASAVAARTEAGGRRPRLDTEAGLPMVRADATLLDQALFNLVENAFVHGGKGEVTIRAHRDSGGGLAFDVLDEGAGLAPGEEQRIFERFVRGSSPAAGSAGLGLAIVKGFSGLMGAQVSARNRPDRSGAIFSIVFPPGALA
jgi:two-component system sensor histidine kinase KdpD